MRRIPGTILILILSLLALPAWPEPVRVTGQVAPPGAPGARVELHSYPATQGAALATARPGTDGSFVLIAPDSGFYRVIVRADDMPEMEYPLVPLVEETELPAVRLGQVPVPAKDAVEKLPEWRPAERPLPPSAALVRTGRVVDALTHEPVARALVWQEIPGASFSWARTAEDGSFRMAAEAGRPIAAVAPGYARAVRPEVPPESPATLSLKPAVTLTGRLVTPEGRPAAGVEVVLEDPDAGTGAGLEISPEAWRATSDADGRFRIAQLGRGFFVLRTTHPDVSRVSQVVRIPEKVTVVDLGEIRLEPGAALEGEILDEQGVPVQGARVSLRPALPYSREDPRLLTASVLDPRPPIATDTEGRFRFPRLTAGSRFDLVVFHPDHPPSYVPGVEIPRPEPLRVTLRTGRILTGRVVDDAGQPVPDVSLSWDLGEIAFAGTPMSRNHARTDAEGGFDLRQLKPGPLALTVNATGFLPQEVRLRIPEEGEHPFVEIVLDRGAAVAGRVLTERGGPVAGATVRLHVGPFEGNLRSYESVTDREGRYRIGALPRGQHRIEVRAADGRTVERGIEIGDRDLSAFDVTLTSGLDVSGRVTDLEGAPIAGADLRLHSATLGASHGTRSGDDGSFLFDEVPEGKYRLTASAEGFADTVVPQEVEVVGGPSTGVEIRLEPGGAISGRILGFAEHELPRIEVTAVRDDRPSWLPLRSLRHTEGRYRITGVPLGAWRVVARLTEERLAEGTVWVSAPGEEAVLDLRLAEGVALSGRVRLHGEPLSGAMVTVGDAGSEGRQARQTLTRYDGRFTVPTLPPGRYRLLVLAGEVRHVQEVVLPLEGELVIDLGSSPAEKDGAAEPDRW